MLCVSYSNPLNEGTGVLSYLPSSSLVSKNTRITYPHEVYVKCYFCYMLFQSRYGVPNKTGKPRRMPNSASICQQTSSYAINTLIRSEGRHRPSPQVVKETLRGRSGICHGYVAFIMSQ